MNTQNDRRPAPILIVLMILGIVVFMLFNGGDKPKAQPLTLPTTVGTQLAPTLVPATPEINKTAEARLEDTYQRDAKATEVARVQKQTEAAMMAVAAYAQTMTANQAIEQRQLIEHETKKAQIEMERALTIGGVILASGLAVVIVLMVLALTVRLVLEAQRKADQAVANRVAQERLLVEARRRMVETRTLPVYQPAMQPADKLEAKLEPMPMNGKTYHTDWTKKTEPEEEKIKGFPLAG